jgi:hypothetical protein
MPKREHLHLGLKYNANIVSIKVGFKGWLFFANQIRILKNKQNIL